MLAFGIWFAFFLFFFKKIQFNLFLVLHFKKVHQNTDIFFLAKSVKQEKYINQRTKGLKKGSIWINVCIKKCSIKFIPLVLWGLLH